MFEMSDDKNLPHAPIVGDHLAMDLLNTQARNGEKVVEYWNSDADVLRWLQQNNIYPAEEQSTLADGELLLQAKALRSLAHQLITGFKQEKLQNISELNTYLHSYVSAPYLAPDNDGKLVITRISRGDTAASMLGQVAEAVAQLLVEGDATLVKQCEHPDCILWFYDRTKAHKRRWCSMATCGNRYKAAQFRKRKS
ncbi:CGNR zinc finger domain-containing protein [Pseudoalteromonas mariniglutinosa]